MSYVIKVNHSNSVYQGDLSMVCWFKNSDNEIEYNQRPMRDIINRRVMPLVRFDSITEAENFINESRFSDKEYMSVCSYDSINNRIIPIRNK